MPAFMNSDAPVSKPGTASRGMAENLARGNPDAPLMRSLGSKGTPPSAGSRKDTPAPAAGQPNMQSSQTGMMAPAMAMPFMIATGFSAFPKRNPEAGAALRARPPVGTPQGDAYDDNQMADVPPMMGPPSSLAPQSPAVAGPLQGPAKPTPEENGSYRDNKRKKRNAFLDERRRAYLKDGYSPEDALKLAKQDAREYDRDDRINEAQRVAQSRRMASTAGGSGAGKKYADMTPAEQQAARSHRDARGNTQRMDPQDPATQAGAAQIPLQNNPGIHALANTPDPGNPMAAISTPLMAPMLAMAMAMERIMQEQRAGTAQMAKATGPYVGKDYAQTNERIRNTKRKNRPKY